MPPAFEAHFEVQLRDWRDSASRTKKPVSVDRFHRGLGELCQVLVQDECRALRIETMTGGVFSASIGAGHAKDRGQGRGCDPVTTRQHRPFHGSALTGDRRRSGRRVRSFTPVAGVNRC